MTVDTEFERLLHNFDDICVVRNKLEMALSKANFALTQARFIQNNKGRRTLDINTLKNKQLKLQKTVTPDSSDGRLVIEHGDLSEEKEEKEQKSGRGLRRRKNVPEKKTPEKEN